MVARVRQCVSCKQYGCTEGEPCPFCGGIAQVCRCGRPATEVRHDIVRDRSREAANAQNHVETLGMTIAACSAGAADCIHNGHDVFWKLTGRSKHWCADCLEPVEWSKE